MILYPAIDLKDGQCVRVVHGDLNTATVFNEHPADQAKIWAATGFSWLHVIDLNGSVEGRAVNSAAVEAILEAVSIPVIAAGGLAAVDDIVRLKARPGVPIAGAVLGRSLYVGAILPAEALAAAGRKVAA